MNLTVLGCSPSFLNPGGHSSGYLIEEGDTRVLVDCGHGSSGPLREALDPRTLRAVVISHMHPDHFFDLLPLRYALAAQDACLPLWLPPGGTAVLQSLVEPLGLQPGFWERGYAMAEYDPAQPLPLGAMTVRFAPTDHFVPGFAMRLTATGSAEPDVFFSSDTAWSAAMADFGRGAALGLIEATQTYQIPDAPRGHLTGALAGRLARDAEIGRLLLTHYPVEQAEQLLAQASAVYRGPVELAREGEKYVA